MNLERQTKKVWTIIYSVRRHILSLKFRKLISSTLTLSSLIIFATIAEKVHLHNQNTNRSNNLIRLRQIPTVSRKPIQILVFATQPSNKDELSINNNENILILTFDKYKPLKIFTFPKELETTLPGQKDPLQLEEIYQLGNINLVLDALAKIIRINPRPNRYILLPKLLLQEFIKNSVQIRHRPRSNKNTKNNLSEYKHLQVALMKKLYRPSELLNIITLLHKFHDQIDTNLSEIEILNLLVATLDMKSVLQVQQLQSRYKKASNSTQIIDQ